MSHRGKTGVGWRSLQPLPPPSASVLASLRNLAGSDSPHAPHHTTVTRAIWKEELGLMFRASTQGQRRQQDWASLSGQRRNALNQGQEGGPQHEKPGLIRPSNITLRLPCRHK